MKKIGTVILIAGVILLVAVGVKSIKDKKNNTNVEQTQQSHPFPWTPLIGGALVAFGIILKSGKERS